MRLVERVRDVVSEQRYREAIKAGCSKCNSRLNYFDRFQDPGAAARREALIDQKMGTYAKLATPRLIERVRAGL